MMKRYDSYKVSNLSGIGDIPEHWGVRKLKYEASFNDEVLSDKTDDDYEIEYVEISNVQATKGITNTEVMPFKDAPSRARRLVRHGDVIVSTVRTYLRAIAKIENPPSNMVVSTGFAVIRPKGIEYRFAGYLFTSEYIIDEIISKSVGVSYPAINASDLVNMKAVLPPHNEQVSIADFLDDKTSQIDSLIQKKQQMIALLEEEKTAVINEAVTKGLNPDAPMKDSGIEWLGMVPEHWEVKKLKYVANINENSLPETTDADYELNYIDISNVFFGGHNEPSLYKFKDAPSRARRIVKAGDILVSTVRTYLKAITQINLDIDNLIASTGFAVITSGESIIDRYLFNIVSSQKFVDTISAISTGVSYPAINASDLGNIYIWYPTSKAEQEDIINYISNEVSHKVSMQEKLQKEVHLLQEFRTALISEAVTGKIDVRDYQPEPISSTALA